MQRKKSRFWSFIWSLMPGAGEMYLGFMKMGLSLMIGFMGLIILVALTNIGALSVLPITMWFYSFFHANNLAALDDQTFMMMKDQYLFGMDNVSDLEQLKARMNGKTKKIAAVVLIVIGVVMLWQTVFSLLCEIFGWDNYYLSSVYYFMRDDLPRILIGVAVIWWGIVLIRGKKADFDTGERRLPGDQPHSGNFDNMN
ncbi:MAG: hypothetical protein HDR09_20400 [Lachnospiraceae bacterium]|nr:hypothetical protein [Lachnospiraceae bacterium]